MVEVLLQMKLAWLEVEVVAENEKAENMEQIEPKFPMVARTIAEDSI